MIKRCSKCKKYKFKWKYNKNRRKKDGLQHQCRPCQHEYHNNKWYPKNKDKRVKSVKDYKWRKREENYRRVVKEYFVNGCVDCGVYYVKNSRTNQDMPHKFQFYKDFIENKTGRYRF